jgi:hypothetical protein
MSIQISKSGNQLSFTVMINNFRRHITIPADSESLLFSQHELTDQNPYNITFPKMRDINKAFIDCGYIDNRKINPSAEPKVQQPESPIWSNLNPSVSSPSTMRKSKAQKNRRDAWITLQCRSQREPFPRKSQATSTIADVCPLQKISPRLAVSIDIEAIEGCLDLSLALTPRTRIIEEWQSELDAGSNRQDLSKTINLVVPMILLSNSVCSVNSEDAKPVELEGSYTKDEFLDLGILTEVLPLSWYYSLRASTNISADTPRPLMFLMDKEFSNQTPYSVNPRVALQLPNNTPGLDYGIIGNRLIDTFARRVEGYTWGEVVSYLGSSPKAADGLAADFDAQDMGAESPVSGLQEEAISSDSEKSGFEKVRPRKVISR